MKNLIEIILELQQAKNIAIGICYKLQTYCEKINIAGSIRRQKPEVKDIEIICLPAKQEIETDLFDRELIIHPGFILSINALGKIIKGSATGKMMQIELPEDIMLDLFIPDDFDYYRQYVIRTGSSDYSFKVIAAGWRKIGWCGSDKGLRKMIDCVESKQPDGKSKWKCINGNAELPPVWESEEEFFNWIKAPFIHPSKRSL